MSNNKREIYSNKMQSEMEFASIVETFSGEILNGKLVEWDQRFGDKRWVVTSKIISYYRNTDGIYIETINTVYKVKNLVTIDELINIKAKENDTYRRQIEYDQKIT